MSTEPCKYPRCNDGTGNPVPTDGVFCPGCRVRYSKLLERVVSDFAMLKAYLPKPAKRPQLVTQSSGVKSFGHPSEWASNTAQEIAQLLREQHDALAEDNRSHFTKSDDLSRYMRHVHQPAPPRTASEPTIVSLAYRYLTANFDDLCTFHAAEETAIELNDIHRQVLNGMGHFRIRERLPGPCHGCGTVALVQEPSSWPPMVECTECGDVYTRELYDDDNSRAVETETRLAGERIDELLDQYDAGLNPTEDATP